MSADETAKAQAHLRAVGEMLAKYVEAQRARDKAEAVRRASLTPQQRAAEDRARAAQAAAALQKEQLQKIAKLGDVVRKADTWTIADFCWLLLAERPGELEGFTSLDGRSGKATRQHKQFREILESCIDTRLRPVNPKDPPRSRRFRVRDLIAVARAKNLGCHAVLSHVYGIAPGSEQVAVEPIQMAKAEQPKSTAPAAPPKKPRTLWHGVTHELLLQIEAGAKQLGHSLSRDALPEGSKQLLTLVRQVCEQRRVKAPPRHETLLRQVNKLGWAFGGGGVRDSTGELKRLADAGAKTPSNPEIT